MARRLALAVALAIASPAYAQASVERQAETARNRAVIEDFVELFYRQLKVREAYEKHVAADYIQHNPMATDGRETAIAFLERIIKANPQHRMEVKRVLVDGDHASVHLLGKASPDDRGAVAVDILRLENGKIVEHWDVTQAVPETKINPRPMF